MYALITKCYRVNERYYCVTVVTLCASDPTSQLINEDEERSVYREKVDMADKYLQTELYQETNQQLEEIWQQLQEREERGDEPRVQTASYARNFFWQVQSSHAGDCNGMLAIYIF